jgi:aspartate racemase
MKSIEKFLSHLNSLNIKIWHENGELCYKAPKSSMTHSLRSELIERKAEIITFLKKNRITRSNLLPPIKPMQRDENLSLSFAQQRLWFLAQLEGQSTTYNIPTALHLSGQLNETALQDAFTALIQHHESLHLCFPVVDGEATIKINKIYSQIIKDDLSYLHETEKQDKVRELIAYHAETEFDLNTGPLLSLRLIKLGQQEHILLLNMHHIISDGWSIGVLIRDWSQLYNAYAQNQLPQLPALPVQYTDYAAWQRKWLQGEILEQQRSFWVEKLTGAPELLELPTDYPRPAIMRYQGKCLQSTLNQELTQGIKQLSQQQSVTVFMTLLAAFNVLLHRYSGQTDLVVGSAIANRTHHQTEDLIGFFVNTLVLRTQLRGGQTFPQLLKQVRQTALDAYNHQDIPFEYLVEQINPTRSRSYSPLFQVMFVLQNAPEEALDISGLKISTLEQEHTTAKFDLTLNIEENGDILICNWEYNTDLFRSDTITRMAEHFLILLEAIINKSEQSLSQLPLLSKTEQLQLQTWNQTQTDYPKDQTIVDLFQAQVEKTPNNIAVVFEGQELSYQELNKKANQLAHHLISLGVKPENLVGICVERSLDMVIGLLGILKAGGAYVPLDPNYPRARLAFMLEDTQVPILLTKEKTADRFQDHQAQAVCLDTLSATLSQLSTDNPVSSVAPSNLVYVMYTSGSTGKPKGINILHRGVVRLVKETNYVNLTADDVFLQLAPISFDASTFEIWGSLLNGAKLIIMPPTAPSLEDLGRVIGQYQVTILWLTASLSNLMINERLKDLKPVRQLLAGGEALSVPHIRKALQELKQCQLINGYGPTENTTFTTCCSITESKIGTSIPIGIPISNTQVYILDSNLQTVPVGVPGELHIGGAGLARGYLNRPNLTAEKFIPNPFSNDPDSHLYKTGDLVRYLPDGHIEYLGRIDNQVKLRGFRIELDEIEAVLSQHETVKEAVVLLYNKEDNPRLIAYVTLAMPIDEVSEVMRTWLKTSLPEYMLPASFTVLDKFPLTPNGKIDRKALPAPDFDAFTNTNEAPRNEIEQRLVQVWTQVLKQTNIGILDNFFERGGNSILSIQIVGRARAAGLEISVGDLLQHQTIAELAQVVQSLDPQSKDSLHKLETVKHHATDSDLDLGEFTRTPFYFGSDTEPLFGWCHAPTGNTVSSLGIVICPPLGYEYMCSHRSLRHLADHFAAARIPALRFDYHGSGNSVGVNEEPDRISAWLGSIKEAIQTLKTVYGCTQISLVGLRMGATLAATVASEVDLASLVLWAPCVQGRHYVQEMKDLQSLDKGTRDLSSTSSNVEALGFVISEQTAKELSHLDLSKLQIKPTKVMIGARDDMTEYLSLQNIWSEQGLNVEYHQLGGYFDMMVDPHKAILPIDAIRQIVSWVKNDAGTELKHSRTQITPESLNKTASISTPKYIPSKNSTIVGIKEHIFQIGPKPALFGILSTPNNDDWKNRPTILLVNSGSTHHMGPHRLYVLLARNLAQAGFSCLRMDFRGLGDSFIDDTSKENQPYMATTNEDIMAAFKALKHEYKAKSFVVIGLCSGGYAAFHAGLELSNEPIVECLLINPSFTKIEDVMPNRHYRHWGHYIRSIHKWEQWAKLIQGSVEPKKIKEIFQAIVERIQLIFYLKTRAIQKKYQSSDQSLNDIDNLGSDLHKLADMERHLTCVCSSNDSSYQFLITHAKSSVKKMIAKQKLSIELIENADHTFSSQTSQHEFIERVTRHLIKRYI